LCLAALQALDLSGLSVLDVGTGSGVLAIAARLLGAQEAIGVDRDPDAVRSATENLALNPAADSVRFEVGDLWSASVKDADVVTANLTGALLARSASRLLGLVRSGGTLIVSGLQVGERSDVVHAFATAGPWRKFSEAPRALETMTRPARTGAPRERMSGAARAPRGASLTWEAEESGWVGLAFNLRAHLEV
jgi:protein-L-isoaspartate O-methyltransferase